jgi:hypothetical protein
LHHSPLFEVIAVLGILRQHLDSQMHSLRRKAKQIPMVTVMHLVTAILMVIVRQMDF